MYGVVFTTCAGGRIGFTETNSLSKKKGVKNDRQKKKKKKKNRSERTNNGTLSLIRKRKKFFQKSVAECAANRYCVENEFFLSKSKKTYQIKTLKTRSQTICK